MDKIYTQKCHVCGKEFVPGCQHRFKTKDYYNNIYIIFCSWGCLCKWRKAHEEEKMLRRQARAEQIKESAAHMRECRRRKKDAES